MSDVKVYSCMFCLKDDSMILQYTKSGKPSLWCGSCRTRVFINTELAYKGLQVFSGIMCQVRDAWERGERDIVKTVTKKTAKGVIK